MWQQRVNSDRKEGSNGLVAVGIDRDKGSKTALRWAIDNLLSRGQTVVLIHVKLKASLSISPSLSGPRMQNITDGCDENTGRELDQQTKDLFLSFHCFCTRKDIQCKDVVLEDTDVVKAILEYVSNTAVENLVIGAASKNGILRRFKFTDIPGSLTKGAPDFCNVYVISKGKVSTMRSATRPAPFNKHVTNQSVKSDSLEHSTHSVPNTRTQERPSFERPQSVQGESDSIRSPFTRMRMNGMSYGELSLPETDISFVSSGRPSIDRTFPPIYEPQRASISSDIDFPSSDYNGRMSLELNPSRDFSYISQESDPTSWPSKEETEAENRRLRLELKQTMDMYSTACKEALTAQQMTMELQRWKVAEEQRLAESRLAEEAALAIAERERAKSRAALEHAEAAKRIAELEAQKRINAEMKALKEAEERKRSMNSLTGSDVRYRKYSIEEIESATEFFADARKIGEGGYGPVYKCYLDHTPVAIKVLRPDAAQGKSQFQQEVEVLSCIRHPNMVLLLGACPEYGCLVYEYMANGSLDDRLFRRGNTPPLSWQIRFRIAAEIGTGLLFLHQTKPEPLVHRDLKPANILLDRNFVSKISDVGLARLVPPSIADNVTQYRMTSTAGTFCYIDPEYQQTGMLGIKSDVYSLGIMLLQIITAKPPMGLTHHVERAIEKGSFTEMLDPTVPDWPVEEALSFARLALRCAELRRKDRPDLGKVVLPELNRLRALAEDHMSQFPLGGSGGFSPNQSQFFSRQEVVSVTLPSSGCGSSRSLSGTQC